jgi:hypothetical protein
VLGALVCVLLLYAPATRADEPFDSILDDTWDATGERAITYVGALIDQPDLLALHVGTAGWWFPQFDATDEVTEAPTGDRAHDGLPAWVGAFNHTTDPSEPGCTEPGALERGCLPTYNFRTFSQDGPARSAGGFDSWSRLRLPSGECGLAGAIVDPHTYAAGEPNNNNTINRIQLREAVPPTFYVSVLTDTTGNVHDPSRLHVRGNMAALDFPNELRSQIEPTFPSPMSMAPNGVPDLYVFRVDGFEPGDYLKLRLRGDSSAASFSGLLFDERFEPVLPSDGPGSGKGHALGHDKGHGPKPRPAPGCML